MKSDLVLKFSQLQHCNNGFEISNWIWNLTLSPYNDGFNKFLISIILGNLSLNLQYVQNHFAACYEKFFKENIG